MQLKSSPTALYAPESSVSPTEDSQAIHVYRKVLGDYDTSEHEVLRHIQYLRSICRNSIKKELGKYHEKISKK
jgi:hypothetical protein